MDIERWQAVVDRSKNHDGLFVFAVKTTKIYCRPSCPSRRPNQENVLFFDLNQQAEDAGFRTCKRCKPTELSRVQIDINRIECACRLLEQSLPTPSLDKLAEQVGLSKFHFHRLFKAHTGLTPKQYAKTCQDMVLRETLTNSESVTGAVFAAGFESISRFYDRRSDMLGMGANDYKQCGKGKVMWFTFADSNLGRVGIAGTENGISAIRIGDSDQDLLSELKLMFKNAALIEADSTLDDLVTNAIAVMDSPEELMELPLDIQGTVFQKRVWDALRNLPTGETATYSELAQELGEPKAVRAVANACGANPVAVAIPCHRVVRSDGGLGGYRWGLDRKKELLKREGARL